MNLLFSQLTTLMLNHNRLAIPHHQWFLTIAINADLPASFIEVDTTDNPWVCDTSSTDYMVSNMPEITESTTPAFNKGVTNNIRRNQMRLTCLHTFT